MAPTYNERSWATDLISFIKTYLRSRSLNIRDAGGEYTTPDEDGKLFADVLLFGDQKGQIVVQGWELKMPDTSITDADLLKNAKRKARTLNLNSFLVWNVDAAALYIRDAKDPAKPYEEEETWELPNGPTGGREHVKSRQKDWEALACKIIGDVDRFLEAGELQNRAVVEALSEPEAVKALFDGVAATKEKFEDVAARNGTFNAKAQGWWDRVKKEYPKKLRNRMEVLARRSLTSWTGKIVFAHVLKSAYQEARSVEDIGEDSTAEAALSRLRDIADACNFFKIFRGQLGDAHLPAVAWTRFTQLSDFLSNVEVESIDKDALEKMLQSTVTKASRRSAGQFTTPPTLAQLLVRVALDDKHSTFYDPFCGTGTVARAAHNVKREYGQFPSEAIASVWASDKFSFPVQMTTLSLARPQHRGEVLRVFKRDVADLKPRMQIDFQDPASGESVTKALPRMDCIAANLPFVQFENVKERNSAIAEVNEHIGEYVDGDAPQLSKGDLYAYLPFYLWDLLAEDGRAGLIMSNAWLGNNWGVKFARLLQQFYYVETVVVSGQGRWFDNADVVTSLVFLRKRTNPTTPSDDEEITFAVLQEPLDAVEDDLRSASAALVRGDDGSDWIAARSYSRDRRQRFEDLGLTWKALFANVDWLLEAEDKLVPVERLFDVERGEKTERNKMFYPSKGHGIEGKYIEMCLQTPKGLKKLVARPETEAFCCLSDKEVLKQNGDSGALSWIRKFGQKEARDGKPLPQHLRSKKPSGIPWYGMRTEPGIEEVDLVIPINPYRLLVFDPRGNGMIDQRFACLRRKKGRVSINLCHALLNSLVGMFYIEALGFGRGQGVLDLNMTKLRENLFMLDPSQLDRDKQKQILSAFRPLLERPVETVPEELARDDRQAFDQTVLDAFGLGSLYQQIREALRELYDIRMAVND
jgi:hypothetical protein